MKRAVKLYILTVLMFAVVFATANFVFDRTIEKSEDKSYVLMNRVYAGISERVSALSQDDITQSVYDDMINDIWYERISEYGSEYSASELPTRVYFLPVQENDSNVGILNRGREREKLWTITRDGATCGFIVFEFDDHRYSDLQLVMNIGFAAVFLLMIGVCTYISFYVLEPFNRLSSYPEKLSKNQLTDKLPESKNRFFGKFTWGINMLNDRLVSDRNRINELSREHLTMLTTIAHGIKTPVSNIKLYSEAIETGMYQADGKANASDAEVASRISKNADDITLMVKELIEKASEGFVDFVPEINGFYLNELEKYLQEEYGNRLELLRIPFSVEISGNSIVKSDKNGICRVLSQLMENAIKYGNGEGISVKLEKQEDGYYITVRNKGSVPEEKELPYLFNSFWRGSNSEGIPGSGIGLFESSEIIKKLGGDIYARSDSDRSEMQFEIYIP
ncbi:MAG: HAMP domain-containing histidine kinase [Lachnospiraceae bacterium]|nr:HAMP domain-containing histidine kinase [Lachnospiraceae bacterium]